MCTACGRVLCTGERHVTRNPAASVVLVDDPLPLTYDEELQLFSGLQPGDVFCYTVPIALSLFVASIAYNVAEVMLRLLLFCTP
jgi:hypothetical protein